MNGSSFWWRDGLGQRGEVLTTYVVSTILTDMDGKYIHEQHAVHHILYHIIFCPKRRKKVLVGPVHDRLNQIIEEVAQENGWQMVELAIQPDHVHLFIQSNPYTMPMDIARLIKGRSSHDLREEFAHLMKMPSLWTRSTFYSTAGFVSHETIQKYIERQSKV
jgi:putative transposase